MGSRPGRGRVSDAAGRVTRNMGVACPAHISVHPYLSLWPRLISSWIMALSHPLFLSTLYPSHHQVIGPSDDGKVFDSEDAQLVLDKGTPRYERVGMDV